MEQQKLYPEPPRASSPPAADAARVNALLVPVHGVQPAPGLRRIICRRAPPPGLSFAAGAQPAMQARLTR
jgi:hypothetical protein